MVNVQEAKTRLSELLARVEHGEEVVIARSGRPVARLSAIAPIPDRQFGTMPIEVPADFDHPLPDDELQAWEGTRR